MDRSFDEVSSEELKEWFRTRVASEVEDAKDAEISAEHVTGWQKGILAWYAEHYVPDDPSSLFFPDGTSALTSFVSVTVTPVGLNWSTTFTPVIGVRRVGHLSW